MSTDAVAISTRSAPSSAPGSPKSRVKFLCSHGGKILPRPSDGGLKYVGGETRVISVPVDISFQELMKKLMYQIDGDMRLKYQVGSEDLDSLVSVRSDEDLQHMLDEIHRHERSGLPRLRTFLFPLNPSPAVDNNPPGPSPDLRALEHQRYIDAINGVIGPGPNRPNPVRLHPVVNAMQYSSRVSSACSSPRSPDSCTTETLNHDPMAHIPNSYYLNTGRAVTSSMPRVRSSPSVCSLNNGPQMNNSGGQPFNHLSPQYVQHGSSFCYQPGRLPVDQQKCLTPDRLMSVGQVEGVRYQLDPLPAQYYTPAASRQSRGNGFLQYDEWGHCMDRRMTPERNVGLATSPVSASPLRQVGRAWDRNV